MINIEEAEASVNSMFSSLTDLNEDLGDTIKAAIGSPVKFIKIKNNLKKWVKAKLDLAAVDMDVIRKKEASDGELKGIDKEKYETAVKAKKDAIEGKMEDIDSRLKELSTTDSLRAVVRLGKTKASLEAHTKLLKIAQGEENDALKLKLQDQIESDKESITNIEDELKTYAKKPGANKEEPKTEAPKSEEPKKEVKGKKSEAPKKEEPKAEEKPTTEEPKEEPKKEEPKTEAPKSEEPKAEEKPKEEPKKDDDEERKHLTKSQAAKKEKINLLNTQIPKLEQELKDKQEAHQITIDNDAEAEANLINAKKDGDESKIKDASDKYSELHSDVQAESSEISGLKDKIETLKNEMQELKKSFESEEAPINQINVSEQLSTDIATKFRALMNKM